MSVDPTRNASPEDPLIDELREIRRKICEDFDNNVDKLCDHLQELERRHPKRLIDRSDEPKPPSNR